MIFDPLETPKLGLGGLLEEFVPFYYLHYAPFGEELFSEAASL